MRRRSSLRNSSAGGALRRAASLTPAAAVALLGAVAPQNSQRSIQVPSGMVRLAAGKFVMGTDPARIDSLLERFNQTT